MKITITIAEWRPTRIADGGVGLLPGEEGRTVKVSFTDGSETILTTTEGQRYLAVDVDEKQIAGIEVIEPSS